MNVYHKSWVQDVPGQPDKIWSFFSRPENLQKITPASMKFQLQHAMIGKEMYEGMILIYKVSPLLGIPMTWATEITHIREGIHFIDEQRVGPYAMWHHEHWFKTISGGVRMTDILYYAVPLGPLGALANRFIIDKKVDDIFLFRTRAIEEFVNQGVFA